MENEAKKASESSQEFSLKEQERFSKIAAELAEVLKKHGLSQREALRVIAECEAEAVHKL